MYYVTLRFDNKKHGTYFVFNRHRFFFCGGGDLHSLFFTCTWQKRFEIWSCSDYGGSK